MIRRLHVEDAHTSAIAIANAKEGREARDDQSFENLASEFKSLLSKISTEYGGLPDQSVALGFALAQSVAQPVHQRPETAPQTSKDDAIEDERGETNPEFKFLSEEDATQGDIEGSLEEQNVSDSDGEKNATREITLRRSYEGEGADSMELVNSNDSLHPVSDAVDSEHQELGASLVADVKPEAVESSGVVDISAARSESHIVIDVVEEAQTATVGDFAGKTVVAPEAETDAQEDETLLDDLSMVADAEDPLYREVKAASKKVSLEQIDPHDNLDKERDLSIEHSHEERADIGDQRSNAFGENAIGGDEELFSSTTKRSVRIGDAALARPDTELSAQFSSNEQFVARAAPKADTTIQMALLRQAFERVQSPGAIDTKVSKGSGIGEGIVPPPVIASTTRSESREETSSSARAKPQSHMGRMLERVDATLKEVARSKDGKSITLKLDPVDLGKVRIDVTLRDGKLHAKITPDNQDVMKSLRENAHDLQGSLRKLGLDVDSVSVSIGFERFEEGETTQQFSSGRSFQEEGHNLPFEDGQLPENMFGNKFAVDTQAGSGEVNPSLEVDHWIA